MHPKRVIWPCCSSTIQAVFVCLVVSAFSLQLYSRATFPMMIYSIAREWLGAYCSDSPASVILCPLLLVWREQGRRSRTSTAEGTGADGAEVQLWQRKDLLAGHNRSPPATSLKRQKGCDAALVGT